MMIIRKTVNSLISVSFFFFSLFRNLNFNSKIKNTTQLCEAERGFVKKDNFFFFLDKIMESADLFVCLFDLKQAETLRYGNGGWNAERGRKE